MMLAGVIALAAQADEVSKGDLDYKPLLLFGGGALLMVGIIQVLRTLKGGQFSATFARVYGLILIATLASALVFADVDGESKTGAFTLLGTIRAISPARGRRRPRQRRRTATRAGA